MRLRKSTIKYLKSQEYIDRHPEYSRDLRKRRNHYRRLAKDMKRKYDVYTDDLFSGLYLWYVSCARWLR